MNIQKRKVVKDKINMCKYKAVRPSLQYSPDGSVEKTKILMQNEHFKNGKPQPLYFPMDHPYKDLQGVFKGMAVILQEQGFGDMSKV